MPSFFGELGKRLADQWVSLLVLPGLLLVITAMVGLALGHGAALDWARLVGRSDAWARDLGALPPVGQALVLVLALLVAAAVGAAVNALGGLTLRIWLGQWPGWTQPIAEKLMIWRAYRWKAADQQVQQARESGSTSGADVDRLAARRNRISLARPVRPTWIGDQIAAADSRVYNQYKVDLQSWWPRLWLIFAEDTRSELRIARTSLEAAATQATWAVGYLLVATIWWPAVLVAVGIGVAGWVRGRTAARVYAELLEAIVDLHALTLATHLRLLKEEEPLTERVGAEITRLLRKGT